MPQTNSLVGPALALTSIAAGCSTVAQRPLADYSRPLPPGASALRLVTDPARYPDLETACRNGDGSLSEAIEQSLAWFEAPSSEQHFPLCGISHEHARASLQAISDLLAEGMQAESLAAELRRRFDVYESVGHDGRGIVLFTGYFAPVFPASLTPTAHFRYPLYRRPADLVTDPATGDPMGRRLADGRIVPYPSRRDIERSGLLVGQELVWLEDPLSVYIIHVNGSAKLQLEEAGGGRSDYYVGYSGKTDRPYTGLGHVMVEEGLVQRDELSLSAIKRVYERQPARVAELINRNENYVFFTEYDGKKWPSGSLGVRVTTKRTLATDKRIYPRGGLVLVDTKAVSVGGRKRDFLQLMLDQDTGGAIQAPGRADIYMGVGAEAETLAGGQLAEGRLYYLFLKPQYLDLQARR